MKNYLSFYSLRTSWILASIVTTLFCFFSVIVNGQAVGIGTGQTYTTLDQAFNAVNSGALNGSIILEVRSNITQNVTATLNAPGTGAALYSSITLRPTGNYSISGSVDGPLIDFTGVRNFTVDGRLNGNNAGAPLSLTIENLHTGINASLIDMRNGANQNTIQHVTLRCGGGSATKGMINLGGTGTYNNVIVQYSSITNSNGNRPRSVFNVNTTGNSSSVIFFGNNVFDVFNPGADSKLVTIGGNVSAAYIMNNVFYETSPIAISGDYIYRAISVESTGSTGSLIQGNIVGGSEANAGGTAMTFTSAFGPQFDAIYVAGGTIASPALVQNNTITNISFQSSRAVLSFLYLAGFFSAINISGTDVQATVSGNTIGSQATNGAIRLFPTNATQHSSAAMIFNNATGSVTIQNNTIGGVISTGATIPKSVIGILSAASGGSHLIAENTIGSSTTPNSIEIEAASHTVMVNEFLVGIGVMGLGGTTAVSNNTIANLMQRAGGSNPNYLRHLAGVYASVQTGAGFSADNNNIHHLNNYSNVAYEAEYSSIVGINIFQNLGSISSISGNSIYEVNNLYSGNLTSHVNGIFFKGGSTPPRINNNFIHSLRLSSANTASRVSGIAIGSTAATATLANNIVSLGGDISNGYSLRGINDLSDAVGNAHRFYFNTIYLSGAADAGSNTAAVYLGTAVPSGRDIRNNILVNARTNAAGTAKHYGLYITGTPTLTADFNDYYTPNTGGVPGFYSADKTALPVVTGQDASSLIQDPAFTAAGGPDAINFMPTAALRAVTIPDFEADFLHATRPDDPYPFMGALHYLAQLPVTWQHFTVRAMENKTVLNWATASEQAAEDFVVQHSVNSRNWINIGTVLAAGNSSITRNYQYTHPNPQPGKNYYRLLQRDHNGKSSLSEVRQIELKPLTQVQILGNPVPGGVLSFRVSQITELELLSSDGKLLWKKRFAAGQHQESMQLMPAGVYYLRSVNGIVTLIK